MTFRSIAHTAIIRLILTERLPRDRVWSDPRIAAWLVWSMRGNAMTADDKKIFNRARHVLATRADHSLAARANVGKKY